MNLLLIDKIGGESNMNLLKEEFTDKAKQAVACKGIRINIPQWFWRKSQTKAEPYGRTLCWGTEKVYADKENWGSNDTFYLYGVPKEETDDAVLFELDYWNLRKAGRYATDAPTEGGWKAWIPKSVIRNLNDIVVPDPNAQQQPSQQNTSPQNTTDNKRHHIQVKDWFVGKLNRCAEGDGVELFSRKRASDAGGGIVFFGKIITTSDKAVLVELEAFSPGAGIIGWKSWVPKSQIESIDQQPIQ